MRRGHRRGGRGGPPLASRPLGLGFDLRVLRTSGLGRPRASRRPARARGRAARSSHNHLTTFAWLARAPTPAKDIARKLGACMQCGAHQPVSRDATGGSARAEWAARRLVVVAQLYKLLVATVADTRDISCAGLRGACMLPSGARARTHTHLRASLGLQAYKLAFDDHTVLELLQALLEFAPRVLLVHVHAEGRGARSERHPRGCMRRIDLDDEVAAVAARLGELDLAASSSPAALARRLVARRAGGAPPVAHARGSELVELRGAVLAPELRDRIVAEAKVPEQRRGATRCG